MGGGPGGRPLGGGREWEADPARIRPATREERLSAGVRAANSRSVTAEELTQPPVPFADCATCEVLSTLRATARAAADATSETDANVLLRRHQREAHASGPHTRRIFRFVPYSIVQDATAEPVYEALCVSGDESDCGAGSGPCRHPSEVEDWQRRHTQETRHLRYRRTFADYAALSPLSPL
ncbi:hypothetical protein [Streptomyces sp. S.PB5]|uniref:DUF7848 domain-containing protein n=1 Tax=Streptomyces sp. S.PB5 TaxID=3020844 RepID=UPI0025B235C9|nr:hypothetical protein [Streptomyces sp. S.PB5]MDN3028850.1 hypothetical protein [Streptomyces sp. S.PB5]